MGIYKKGIVVFVGFVVGWLVLVWGSRNWIEGLVYVREIVIIELLGFSSYRYIYVFRYMVISILIVK